MKTIIKTIKSITITTLVFVILLSCTTGTKDFKDGDIIFQTSKSSQSAMLKMATKSNLTHVGIIFYKNGKPFVLEAVQPVKVTPLESFIKRGEGGKYKVMRYENGITEQQKLKMIKWGEKQLGKPYDIKFQWGNKSLYCSELVWKIYKEAGIELCETKRFSDFNLDNEKVKLAIKQRFKGDFNLNEEVVAPVDLFDSNDLDLIYSNY